MYVSMYKLKHQAVIVQTLKDIINRNGISSNNIKISIKTTLKY